MRNCSTDLIECAAGYQAEISVHGELDVSTRVYPTKEKCKERTEFIANMLGWSIEWSEEDKILQQDKMS